MNICICCFCFNQTCFCAFLSFTLILIYVSSLQHSLKLTRINADCCNLKPCTAQSLIIRSRAYPWRWWAQMDSNHRPRAYQARALTTWAMSPFSCFASLSLWSRLVILSYDWWRWWDSNPWPPACRAGALPTELHPHRCVSRSSLLVFAFSVKIYLDCFFQVSPWKSNSNWLN